MLGAPGSGKGTQAEYLIKRFNIPKISTGDMLRSAIANRTDLGLKVKAVLDAGMLVSDEIILSLIEERIAAPDCAKGFLFDGFPRTIGQAEALYKSGVDVDFIIEIVVPDAEIIKRLTGRLVHVSSGRIYHTEFNPPKSRGIDDYTGEPLVQREDDRKEVVIQRLEVYHKQTAPLISWYQSNNYMGHAKYISVSGLNKADLIAAEITQQLI